MWEGIQHTLRDNPEDWTTHLVAADWLDEEGDEGRAEYVRGWTRLQSLPANHAERPGLGERLQALEKEFGPRWLGADPKNLEECSFAGAMLGRVRFNSQATPEDILSLVRCHAIRELVLPASTAERLAFEPGLALVSGLEIEPVFGFGAYRVLDDLFVSPYLTGLRRLNLRSNLDNSLACLMVRCPVLAGLRTLRAITGIPGDAGAAALARASNLQGLVEWHVLSNRISPLSTVELFAAPRVQRWHSLSLVAGPDMDRLYRCVRLRRLALWFPPLLRLWDYPAPLWLKRLGQLRELRLHGTVPVSVVDWLARWPGLYRLRRLAIYQASTQPGVDVGSLLEASPYRHPDAVFHFARSRLGQGVPPSDELFDTEESAT